MQYQVPGFCVKLVNLCIQELCTHSVECIGGQVNYILDHPFKRISITGFHNDDEETILRYLVDHGYIFSVYQPTKTRE